MFSDGICVTFRSGWGGLGSRVLICELFGKDDVGEEVSRRRRLGAEGSTQSCKYILMSFSRSLSIKGWRCA